MKEWDWLRSDTAKTREKTSPLARRLPRFFHRLSVTKPSVWSLLLAGLVGLAAAGCGQVSNSVEFPENPDPMPSQSPIAAGHAAPAPEPAPQPTPETVEQPARP